MISLREKTGRGKHIPFFSRDDGGVDARCLFLLEAPSNTAVDTGFVTRENEFLLDRTDYTARNFREANEKAKLDRELTLSWYIVPWFVGNGTKMRSPTAAEIKRGLVWLPELLGMLPELCVVVLLGRKSEKAELTIRERRPDVDLIKTYHLPGEVSRVLLKRSIFRLR